jgi:hypothetical protein
MKKPKSDINSIHLLTSFLMDNHHYVFLHKRKVISGSCLISVRQNISSAALRILVKICFGVLHEKAGG